MQPAMMSPYGQALLDYLDGDADAAITFIRDDGFESAPMPAAAFFVEAVDFTDLELAALALGRGHVLDVGAGAGRFSLALQARGLAVTAIDIAAEAVTVMRRRGVRDVRCADVFEFGSGPFDTLLLMMHGIGLVGNLMGLYRFLNHACTLVAPGGQIVLDSLDVRLTDKPVHLAYLEANRRAGRYFGEIRNRMRYGDLLGPPFSWLHVDPETLAQTAQETGWQCRVVQSMPSGDYLAVLGRDAAP